jgi:hypothetical protein
MLYRVRDGFRFGSLDQFGPGDMVELDPQAAAGFKDKLEPVVPTEPEPEPAQPVKAKKPTKAEEI